jgi:hypothetical protein
MLKEVEIEIHFQNERRQVLNVAGVHCHTAGGR